MILTTVYRYSDILHMCRECRFRLKEIILFPGGYPALANERKGGPKCGFKRRLEGGPSFLLHRFNYITWL